MSRPESEVLAGKLTDLCIAEMVAALGAASAPSFVRAALGLPFAIVSRPVGRTLAAFDVETEASGIFRAAALTLGRFGVRLEVRGTCPTSGPLLVVANHPGAYDALALMSAIGRSDLLVIAADRTFLRALPRVARHLLFVPEQVERRASVLRRAFVHLAGGGVLLHFAAGRIEPDPDFVERRTVPLGSWEPGTPALVRAAARASGNVMLAAVRGVHSRRAKRWLVARWAERRGVSTVAPLIQVVARYRDVNAQVSLGSARPAAELAALGDDRTIVEHLRELMLSALAFER